MRAMQEVATALFGVISAALEAAPDCLDPYQAAALFEAAAAAPAAKLPEQVRFGGSDWIKVEALTRPLESLFQPSRPFQSRSYAGLIFLPVICP